MILKHLVKFFKSSTFSAVLWVTLPHYCIILFRVEYEGYWYTPGAPALPYLQQGVRQGSSLQDEGVSHLLRCILPLRLNPSQDS